MEQQQTSYRTGSRVEVSSEDEGFTGAWYTARVLVAPRGSVSSSTPSRNRKDDTFLVQYETLFEDENGVKFLTEVVRSDFIRPLPPPGDQSDDFQLYDVVDAYHRDGWWRGVITGVIDAADYNSDVKYFVSFEYPPEEIEFGRSDLRFHLQWVNSTWVRPPKQIPEMATVTTANGKSEAAMAPGSVVYKRSKRSKDDLSENPTVSDLLSSVIKFKKRSKHKINETVACNSSRRKKAGVPQQSLVRRQKVDGVDKGDAGAMNEMVVRDCATNENELDRLSGKGVSHQPQFSFGKEGLKLMADSGCCLNAATRSHIKSCHNMKKMPLVSTRGEGASQLWKNLLDDHQKRSQSAIETPIEDSPEAPRGGTYQIVQVGPGKGADEIPLAMFSDTCDEQLLLTWLQEMQPPTVIENSGVSHPCLKASTPAAVVHGDSVSKCQKLPFVKSSPVWNNIESLEVFKKMPQKPHFAPLVEFKEDSREGFAIGHMVTFANVVEKMLKLQSSDEQSAMKRSLETLLDLKSHGFEVEAVQVRLERLLSMKDDISHLEGEWKTVNSEVMKHSLEISELEKEMNELEVELRKLQERLAMLAPIKKAKGENIADLRLKVDAISDRIKTAKLEFDQLAASPL